MNNLPVERPDTIASVSPPEPLGAGGADVTLGTRGAIFLAKIAKVCIIRTSIRFYAKCELCEFIIICRLCPGRPGLRRFYYEKLNSTIIGGHLTFELLQLGPTLCGIAINHISFVLLLDSAFALFPLPF